MRLFTLLLILLNLLLFALIYYLERTSAAAPFEAEQRLVLPLDLADHIDGLAVLDQSGATRLRFRREGRAWSLQEPIAWPANPYAISRILTEVRALEWENRFPVAGLEEAGQSLAQYGLDPAQVRLEIRAGARTQTVRLGAPTPLGRRCYGLSPDGEQVLVLGGALREALNLTAEQARSPQLFTIPSFEVRSLTLQAGGQAATKVRLAREGDGWRFESPLATAADGPAVESALQRLLAARITEFLPGPANPEFLQNPVLRVTLFSSDRREALVVGPAAPDSAGRSVHPAQFEGQSASFLIEALPLETLGNAQEALRERYFLPFEIGGVTSLAITQSDRTVTLVRLETGQWQVRQAGEAENPAVWPVDPAILDQTFGALRGLRAEAFVSDAPSSADLAQWGLADPQRRLVLGGLRERVLLVGGLDPVRGLLYARTEDAPSVYLVGPDVLHILPVQALHYRHRQLTDTAKSARWREIRLTDLATAESLWSAELPEAAGDWAEVLASLPEGQAGPARQLLESVRQMVVGSYLRASYQDPLALDSATRLPWRYELRATCELPAGTAFERQTVVFRFTERQGGTTQYGGCEDPAATFTLSQPLIDALHAFTFRSRPPERVVPPAAPATP